MEKRQRSYAINILALLVVFGAFTAVNNAGLINKYYMGIIITIGITHNIFRSNSGISRLAAHKTGSCSVSNRR